MFFACSRPAAVAAPSATQSGRESVVLRWQPRWARSSGGAAAGAATRSAARRLPLAVVARRGGPSGAPRGGRRGSNISLPQLAKEYALPALGLLVAASFVGPLVGGLVMTALGLGAALAFGAAALSVSWVFIPLLAAVFGMPALMAGGMAAGVFATAAAGAFLLPSLLQLALIGGGLWLGATVAQAYFSGGSSGSIDPDSTIDVEVYSVDDDWRNEMLQPYVKPESSVRMLEGGGVVVRLRGLPPRSTAEQVLQFLGAEGLSTDAVHLRCQPRRSTGEAYVVFSNLEEAQKACSKDKDIFCPKSGDRYVRVSIEQDVSPADLVATDSAASGKAPPAKRASHKPESVVKVAGLPRTITPPEVLSLFWGWQVRPASTYILAPAHESLHGEALVDFEVHEHAALAIAQRHGTTITTAAGVFQLSVRHASKAEWDAAVAAQQGNDGILRVKGLPTQAGPLDVLAFFQGYRIKPGGVHVQPVSENKRSKLAMVEFESGAEAAQALQEKNHQQFGGTDRFCLLQLASRAELEQELARFQQQQQQQQQQQTVPAASGRWGGSSSEAPSGIGTTSGRDPGMPMPGSTAGPPSSSMAGGVLGPAGADSAANMLPAHTAAATAGFPHQQPLPLPPMPRPGMHGMMPPAYMLPPGVPPMPGGWPAPMGPVPMGPMPPHMPLFFGGMPHGVGFGHNLGPHPDAMAAAAAAAAGMGAPGAGGLQPWGPMGMRPFQAPNTAAARYMVQDLTTGQRVFLDPRFNLSSYGALPPAVASSAAATAGTMVHGNAIGPAHGSQQVQSELEATATSGGLEEQHRAGQVATATATATADGSGEGSGEGPAGSGGAEAGGCAGGNGNGHSSGNGHSVAAAPGHPNGASVHGKVAGATNGSGNAMLGSSGQSEQTPAGKARHQLHGALKHRHHHHHHHHSHTHHHTHPRSHKPSSSADDGRTNGGSGGGSNEGSDNGSGGDESAAIKRKRMAPDSSSGEGSGAGPRGEDATAMFTAAGGDEGVGNDAAAGLAPAAQAQPEDQQQLHVQKDPAKLHSPPSSGDLQEEGTAPPAVKRTRNP